MATSNSTSKHDTSTRLDKTDARLAVADLSATAFLLRKLFGEDKTAPDELQVALLRRNIKRARESLSRLDKALQGPSQPDKKRGEKSPEGP